MIFASKAFFVFLPIVLILYHGFSRREHRYRVLLAAGWLFYAWVPPHYWPVLFLLTLIDYVAGREIQKATDESLRKRWLTASIVANLGLLFVFKYTPFVCETALGCGELFGLSELGTMPAIVLPLGISFHTFQGISYTVDVYRKQIRAVDSFTDYALFVSFFPQLAAGPIVRAAEFLPQMVEPPSVSAKQISDGIVLFVQGLVKKLIIADTLDELFVGPVFANPAGFDDAIQRWAAVAWAVQIYCDFSGYTDMARGCSKWFGFELPENFRLPFLATSITDFWRRWHLSLSTWLRDYLYFPMGGSRGSALRTYVNLMVLFLLCGLWHGAAWNWLAYGAYNGFWMCAHRWYDLRMKARPRLDARRSSLPWIVVAWSLTTLQFLIGLILIRMADWQGGTLMMKSLVGFGHIPASGASLGVMPTTDWGFIPLVALLMAMGLVGHIVGGLRERGILPDRDWPDAVRLPVAALGLASVIAFTGGTAKTFIYIHF